jgi:peptidyl-prolyl cis-trans isomerase C
MKKYSILLPVALLAALGGCDQLQTSLDNNAGNTDEAPAAPAAPAGEAIATVNGAAITQQVLDVYMNQRMAKGGNQEASQEDVMKELVSLELMSQEAARQGLDKDPAVAATLNQLQRSTLAGAAIQAFITANPVSDEAVQEAYDSQFGAPGKEYKARHILLDNEEDAKSVIGMLDSGRDFSELAKEKSTGPSGPSGGELGWFSAGQMVAEFSEATAAMEKGTYSKTPVKTQFGWHVIMLDDVRDSTPPPFEDIKERIRMVLANQQLQAHVAGLRETASVDIK